ncbi:MAG TPA: hypothetical protein V6D15_09540 [Oculatellaceae cyanobacterium]|jgi:superfamily I DNA/RNA helicase
MKRIVYLNSLSNALFHKENKCDRIKVITPNIQAARVWQSPHQTLSSIAESIVRAEGLNIAPVLIAHRLIRHAVAEVIETSDIEGTARTLTPTVKSILRAGTDLQILENVSSPRIKQLACLTRTYTSHLKEAGFLDLAEVLWQAIRLNPQRQPILLYAYFHPSLDELAFINALAGDGSAMLLPCPNSEIFADNQETIGWLLQQGWQVEVGTKQVPTLGKQLQDCFLNKTALSSEVQAHVYPHLEAEVRGVLAQIKNLLSQGVAANQIVMVARDETLYGPTILDVANEYNLPVRALYAIPLISTRLGAWVQLLLQAIQDKLPFESTAKLLSHPLCSGLPAEVWSEARKVHPQGLLVWQSLGINLALLDWPEQDTRAEWVQRLQDVLNKFEVRRRSGRWAREIVAFYELQAGLVELAKPETEFLSLADFAQDVLESLNLLTVPAQPGRGGVELHTPLSLFGAKLEYVFVLGAAEGILPAPIQDNPVLDFYDRKQLAKQGFRLE